MTSTSSPRGKERGWEGARAPSLQVIREQEGVPSLASPDTFICLQPTVTEAREPMHPDQRRTYNQSASVFTTYRTQLPRPVCLLRPLGKVSRGIRQNPEVQRLECLHRSWRGSACPRRPPGSGASSRAGPVLSTNLTPGYFVNHPRLLVIFFCFLFLFMNQGATPLGYEVALRVTQASRPLCVDIVALLSGCGPGVWAPPPTAVTCPRVRGRARWTLGEELRH